jgi:hypothetical protein
VLLFLSFNKLSEGLYHQDAHRNIVEKLKKVKVVSFQTIEEIFKIEFQKNAQIQIDEKEKTIEQIEMIQPLLS